jgi:hypothetical protein
MSPEIQAGILFNWFSAICIFRIRRTNKLLAYAYIWANASDPDLYGEWDFEVRMLVPALMFLYDDALKFTIKTSICCLQE